MTTTGVNANIGAGSSGSVQSNGSTTYITGISSGLNTQALIDAGYSQKLQPYTDLQTKISNNTNIISSYSTLQLESQTMISAFDQLQSVTQDTTNTNVFDSKSVSYAASDSSAGSNIVSATTATGAAAGTHTVVVKKIAQALSVTSNAQGSATTALGSTFAGTFNIAETGKTAALITVTATSTLTDVKNAINATTTTSGVKADLLQVAGGGYKLVLTSSDTAKSFTATTASGADVLQNLGVNDSGGAFANVSQAAQQADFVLDGTEILSDTNTLNNVLTGLNLQLVNAAPNTTVTLTLGNNVSAVTNSINSFVSAYNQLRSSLDTLQKTNADGTVADGAYLANDPLTRQFQQQLQNVLSRTYLGSSLYSGLGALGITFDATNELTVNTTTLSNALNNHFSDVQAFFQTSNGVGGLADSSYTILKNFADATTGQFKTNSDSLTSIDADLGTKAADYKTVADNYKTFLINKYATLETSVSQSQIKISQIKAILAGSSPSSN